MVDEGMRTGFMGCRWGENVVACSVQFVVCFVICLQGFLSQIKSVAELSSRVDVDITRGGAFGDVGCSTQRRSLDPLTVDATIITLARSFALFQLGSVQFGI